MARPMRLGIVLLVTFAVAACDTSTVQMLDEDVLAKVGPEVLTVSEAVAAIDSASLRQDSLAALRNFQRQWIDRQLLLQHAKRIGVDRSTDYRSRLDRMQEQLLTDVLHEQIARNRFDEIDVDLQEATEYYQANRQRFQLEEPHVRVRHLSTSRYADASEARNALLQGIKWEDVVDRYSANPEFEKEYAELHIPIAMAVAEHPTLNRLIPNLGLQEISEIYRLGGTWHFVQVVEYLPDGEPPDLEWLLLQIQTWLELEKRRKLIQGYVRNLYLQADASNELLVRPLNDDNRNPLP